MSISVKTDSFILIVANSGARVVEILA